MNEDCYQVGGKLGKESKPSSDAHVDLSDMNPDSMFLKPTKSLQMLNIIDHAELKNHACKLREF